MQFPQTFDATQFDPQGMSNQLPVSDAKGHVVMVTEGTIVPTKSGDGNMMVVLTLTIQEGEHKGKTGDYRLNLFNSNTQTVEIAQRQLSAVCHVTGKLQINAPSDLVGVPFRAVVAKQKPKKNEAGVMEESNFTEVKGVLDVHGNTPRNAQPPVTGGSPAGPGNSAPPQNLGQDSAPPVAETPATAEPVATPDASQPAWNQQNSDVDTPPWAKQNP